VRTIDDRTGLEVLSENECLLLLGRTTIGRLAMTHEGRPEVFPVNFRRDGRSIVFRTDEGTKLDRIQAGHPVAFEVDELEPEARAGWSVVVTGQASDVTDAEAAESLRKLRIRPWSTGPKSRYVRLLPERIEGRRIVRVPDSYYGRDA
jgi:nitroimidazol reductase NimA-like FMN-containing flavoprotein (pyridoxamine 5'-phosphate oxidase superfamily)